MKVALFWKGARYFLLFKEQTGKKELKNNRIFGVGGGGGGSECCLMDGYWHNNTTAGSALNAKETNFASF